MKLLHHYVCDRCGNYWRAHRAAKCPACRHEALWEYEPNNGVSARIRALQIAGQR